MAQATSKGEPCCQGERGGDEAGRDSTMQDLKINAMLWSLDFNLRILDDFEVRSDLYFGSSQISILVALRKRNSRGQIYGEAKGSELKLG